MRMSILGILFLCFSSLVATAADRVQLTLDSSEADAVLSILSKRADGKSINDADWQALFAAEPYKRLKIREASMHRDFTDADFQKFVLSADIATKTPQLKTTLAAWKKADLARVAGRILPYLPDGAHVKASVYPVVKPKTNSFVFETDTNPAIFLYLDPEQSQSEFEITKRRSRLYQQTPGKQPNGWALSAKDSRCLRQRARPKCIR